MSVLICLFQFLMNYIMPFNCHRVMGIRPRGCDNALGIVADGAHKIIGKIRTNDEF